MNEKTLKERERKNKKKICLQKYNFFVEHCLFFIMSVCLSVSLSICLFVYLSLFLSVFMSICPSVYLSTCLFVHLSICPSVYLSICLIVYLYFVYLSDKSACLSICLFVYLCCYNWVWIHPEIFSIK